MSAVNIRGHKQLAVVWCGVVTVFGGPKDGGEVVITLVVVASSTVLLLVPMTMFSVSTGVLS